MFFSISSSSVIVWHLCVGVCLWMTWPEWPAPVWFVCCVFVQSVMPPVTSTINARIAYSDSMRHVAFICFFHEVVAVQQGIHSGEATREAHREMARQCSSRASTPRGRRTTSKRPSIPLSRSTERSRTSGCRTTARTTAGRALGMLCLQKPQEQMCALHLVSQRVLSVPLAFVVACL